MNIPKGLLPERSPELQKGDAGRVFLLAGSLGMSGAAALCTWGALRMGAGLVTLGLPRSIHEPMAGKITEAMLKVLPETKAGPLSMDGLAEIVTTIEKMDVVALGPGLSQESQTKELVIQLIPKIVKPLVIDADGLNALSGHIELLQKRMLPAILTPHPGEMGRLTYLSAQDIQKDRLRIAKSFAEKYRVVVVLKGHGTVVANIDGAVWINDTGNPGMASGGCGDVLTGMIAGLLGWRLPLFDAARLGVYLHGRAGDIAKEQQGEVSLLASDLVSKISAAIREYQSLPT